MEERGRERLSKETDNDEERERRGYNVGKGGRRKEVEERGRMQAREKFETGDIYRPREDKVKHIRIYY